MHALILAGGLGTRLSTILKDQPKPMAPIGKRPFLEFIIAMLEKQGIRDIVLLTGHKSGTVEKHFGDGRNFGVSIIYSIEREPLGTGGAVKLASGLLSGDEDFLVLNGDTYFNIDYMNLIDFHKKKKALMTVSLKYVDDPGRYGSITIQDYRVSGFIEKGSISGGGYINGGVMVLSPGALSYFRRDGFLSLEREVMPSLLETGRVFGIPFGGKFIDIGIPDDYRASLEKLPLWERTHMIRAAFLDRDGIINEDNGYLYRVKELKLLDGSVSFLKVLKKMGFSFIIITNQSGIGKGIFSEEDYHIFQNELIRKLSTEGIDILDSFFCPFHPEASILEYRWESILRKPEPGMVLAAADKHFIDIAKSVMIGDKESDRIHLPYLRNYILRGHYDVDESLGVYSDFDEILEAIKNDWRDS